MRETHFDLNKIKYLLKTQTKNSQKNIRYFYSYFKNFNFICNCILKLKYTLK